MNIKRAFLLHFHSSREASVSTLDFQERWILRQWEERECKIPVALLRLSLSGHLCLSLSLSVFLCL